jgi:hypothetical protein
VNGIPAAVILPQEGVRIHEKRVREIIAPCSLKKALGLENGDRVTVAEARGGKAAYDAERRVAELKTPRRAPSRPR